MNRSTVFAVLFVVVVSSSGATPLASAATVDGRISFARYDPDLGDTSIWTANPDGSHQVRVTEVPSYFSDWSPNGRRLAFDFVGDDGEHIATVPADGGHVRQITSASGIQEVPKYSPDGAWIAFDASPVLPDDPAFATSIWVVRPDGSDAHALTADAFDVEPVFSPDSSRIAFGRITGTDANGAQLEAIYVVGTDGAGLREIVPPTPALEHPDWSPGGRWITYNIEPGAPDAGVWAVHPNGRGARLIHGSEHRFGLFKAVWSPSGDAFLVGCHDFHADIDMLCVMDADGRHLHVVVDDRPTPVNFPAWGTHPLAA